LVNYLLIPGSCDAVLKKLEVTVNLNQKNNVQKVFKNLELSYSTSTVTMDNQKCQMFSSLIPDNLVGQAIEEISTIMDMRLKENTINIQNIEAHISTQADRVREKISKKAPPPNPFERLVETTSKFTKIDKDVTLMALFATIIVLAGLFLDNTVIVIGAMLISPLLGPINAFALNASIGKVKKLVSTEISIITILTSVIFLSFLTTYGVSQFVELQITSQILLRSQTTLLDVAIGLILGLAGGLALVAHLPEILVGVGVASAILPPAAVTGVGLALMDFSLFFGALTLIIVYLVGLELGCTIMFRIKGVRPRRFYEKAEAKKRSSYFIIIFSILLLSLIVIIYQTSF
jgi:uncharacterized hydrophobic protein (TIGR00341 family)